MIKRSKTHITIDRRGKIKSGKLGKSKDGTKDIPKSLDYFNVEDFPELIKAYSPQPRELVVFCPTDNIPDFFNDEFCHYAGGKENPVKVRSCDGEECIHRIDESIAGTKYGAGEISNCACDFLSDDDPQQKKQKCRYLAYFKAYIGLPPTFRVDNPNCYLFETGSENSGGNILSQLEKIHLLNNGHLYGVPFKLTVQMVSGKTDAKEKFPIWHLTTMYTSLIQMRADHQLTDGIIPEEKLLEAPEVSHDEVPILDVMESDFNEIERTLNGTALDEWVVKYKEVIAKLPETKQKILRGRYKALADKIEAEQKKDKELFV